MLNLDASTTCIGMKRRTAYSNNSTSVTGAPCAFKLVKNTC